MPTEKFDPPLHMHESLSQPLTPGEKLFRDWLHHNLTSDWEVYVQPYMNGLRPDFVLLSPRKGIAVYEVKDWNLSVLDYRYVGSPPKLIASDDRKTFALGEDRDPVLKIRTYKSEIFDLYCPSLGLKHGFGAIVGGIVFPFASTSEILNFLKPALDHYGYLNHPRSNVIVGRDVLAGEATEKAKRHILPPIFQITNEMSDEIADDLRHWLLEPEAPKDQRKSAFEELDDKQKELVATRTSSGWRRVKGAAGSGKTLVLCGRAARLIAEDKKVLLVAFNITLLNYLRDTIARFFVGSSESRTRIARRYTVLNFHLFCKRVALATGNETAYNAIWKAAYGESDTEMDQSVLSDVLAARLPGAAISWVEQLTEEQKYDAILVDEGQDLRKEWWTVLTKALRTNGEILLVADATQNVYGLDQSWTDAPLVGAGFPGGGWSKLTGSYRMPPELSSEAARFIDEFLPDAANTRPVAVPKVDEGLFSRENSPTSVKLRWVNVFEKGDALDACIESMNQMIASSGTTDSPLNYADLTFLVENAELGIALRMRLNSKHIRVIDTFDPDERISRRKKLAFRKGDGRVKVTNVFSFKGWETRALILQVGNSYTEKDRAVFFTGMTRLKMCYPESYLTVVSSAQDFTVFGSRWPEFVDGNLNSRSIQFDTGDFSAEL